MILYSVGAAHVLQAMQQHRVRRLLTVTAGTCVQDEADPPLVRLVVKPLLTTIGSSVPNGWQIARADVSDYILTHLDTPDAYRATVALAYECLPRPLAP